MTRFDTEAAQSLVLIEGGPPSNYSAWSPDLPGCTATGATVAECEREMREAIVCHLEGLTEDCDPVPPPSGGGVYTASCSRAADDPQHPGMCTRLESVFDRVLGAHDVRVSRLTAG
jgi:predicted RNase H-like HicB family nuclease